MKNHKGFWKELEEAVGAVFMLGFVLAGLGAVVAAGLGAVIFFGRIFLGAL